MIINKKRFKKIHKWLQIKTNACKQRLDRWGDRGTCQQYNEMRLSVQFQAWFFYEKISHAQKLSQANINQQNKIKQTLNNKGNNFSREQKLLRVKVFVLHFGNFCAREIFS